MIYFQTRTLASNRWTGEIDTFDFENAEDAIRKAMSYDHEYEVWMMDTQGSPVKFAYCWLNKIHVSGIASGDFVTAAKRICSVWPYQVA